MPVLDVPPPAFMQDPDIQMFADSANRFFERAAPPERVLGWREAGQVERSFWRETGAAGFLGVTVPEAYGGPGADFRHELVLLDVVARQNLEGFALGLHNVIVTPYIVLHGSEEQKRRWLPKLVSGERVCAIAMSEPGAGSDLQAIRTTARRDGDGYRISGSKTFISNGQIADFIVVVAKTDPAQGSRGVSLVVVETDEAQGFRRGKKLDKVGQDAQDTSELFFDDVWVPAAGVPWYVALFGRDSLIASLQTMLVRPAFARRDVRRRCPHRPARRISARGVQLGVRQQRQ